MRPEQIDELKRIASEIKNIDHCYGSGLLIPQATKVNSSRSSMSFSQISQSKNLNNSEMASVGTGYEKLFSDRSTSYLKLDREYQVVKRVNKFEDSDMYYALILKEVNADYYHIVFRHEVESFAEASGVKMNNTFIDSLKPGDIVNENDVIYKSNSYDSNMNYMSGVNAKAVYIIDPATTEDGQKISDVFAEKMSSISVIDSMIHKNGNDVLLNWYGNSKIYKCFPDVGETVKDGILCIKRRADYNNAQYVLKNRNLRKEMHGDVVHYADNHGTVVDIDIYSNIMIDNIADDPSNAQLLKYMRWSRKYWKTIFDFFDNIKDDDKNTYSDDVGAAYARARDILSIGQKIIWNNDTSLFDHMIIAITVLGVHSVYPGSKLVGRHGNKGVVVEIVPQEQMIRCEDGTYADIVLDALGVIGRLNIGQLSGEQELNWLVDSVLSEKGKSPKEKFNAILDILSLINDDQMHLMKDYYDELSKDEKEEFLEEFSTKRFTIFQPPSKTLSFDNYAKLIDKYEPKKKRFTVKDPSGTVYNIQQKLIMGDSYVLRLKHEPKTKFSVRNKGTINPRTFMPIKSQSYSRGTALFNNQAVRIGNMEMDILYLCNDPAAINYMLRLYCTSVVGRRQIGNILDENIFSNELQIDMEDSNSRIVNMFDSTFLTCGFKLDIELEDDNTPLPDTGVDDIMSMGNKEIKLQFKDGVRDLFY